MSIKHCTLCKVNEANSALKYFGGIYCPKCYDKIRFKVENGRLPAFRELRDKSQDKAVV